MTNGYDFYFKTDDQVVTFPITPGELTIKIGSNNDVVNLINEGDINIPKSPSLIEVEFEARFPMRQYPYARKYVKFNVYWKIFKQLKEKKEPFRFIVVRKNPKGDRTWDTNLLMVIEDIELHETADEGDDVLITFKLKQYKEYGVVKIKRKKTTKKKTTKKKTTKKKTTKKRTTKKSKSKTYIVKKGDCLWLIAKKFYGKGSYNKKIYKANKTVIEKTARKYGKKSSSNGWWIYPGTKLVIPALK